VSLADFLCREEIRLDFSEAGPWVFRSKELLNVLIQPELIFLDRKNVVPTLADNLCRNSFLGM
jgi:hypothetical protein